MSVGRSWLSIDSRVQTIIVFFFNDTATTEIYTLSLHDALPIYGAALGARREVGLEPRLLRRAGAHAGLAVQRSEEHTSELQSQSNLVCRLLLEKKKRRARGLRPPHPHDRLVESILRHSVLVVDH